MSQSQPQYKHIYGPVNSWRLGVSLGIDPISRPEKICNMDCVYCQLGKTAQLNYERQEFVATDDIIREIYNLPFLLNIDCFTFSGRGEPTLASNLGEMIQRLKFLRNKPVAVITNSGLIHREDVQQDLLKADFVLAKLDACSGKVFECIARSRGKLEYLEILEGLCDFRKRYKGKLALQIMFIEHNKPYARQIAELARVINPDEVQLNTPLRPSAVKPLTVEELREVAQHFSALPVVSVYDRELEDVRPMNTEDTIKRHGNFNIKN